MVGMLKLNLDISAINFLLLKRKKLMSVCFNVMNFIYIDFNFILRWHFNEKCKWIRKKTLVTNIWNKSSAERFEGGGQ